MAPVSLLGLLVSLGATFIAYRWYLAYNLRRKAQQHGCQAPARYKHKDPIFGLDIFLRTGDAMTKNQFLVEHQRRYDTYGHTFEALNFGSRALYSVHPENLKVVFSQNAADWGIQPLRLKNMSPFCGAGFITTDGSEWKISHDLLKPAFHRSNISDFSALEQHLRLMLSQLPKDGSKFDLQPYILNLYLDMNTLFLFGEPIGMLSGNAPSHAEGFLDAFREAFTGCGMRIALGPLGGLMPKGAWLEACNKVHQFANVYVDRAIEYHRKYKSSDEDGRHKPTQRTLLFNMAQQTDDRTLLRDQAIQAMMAATETTAALVSHVIRNLSRHPDVYAQVRAEVLALGDRSLDFDQLPRIKSLQNVITETLRLYPVFPQNNRVALKDTILPVGGGSDRTAPVFAPAGTLFDTCFATLHRNPEIWGPDADDFRPSRWESHQPAPFTFMPFGAGPRQCLAQQKATMETSYIVSRMLQEFREINSEEDKPYQAMVALTAKSAHGCQVSLNPA